MEMKSCCFIGHRKVQDKERVMLSVKQTVEALIIEKGVRVFRFGSRSEFDDICHRVVTELQSQYPDLVRVNYHCKSEHAVMKEEQAMLEASMSSMMKKYISIKDYDAVKSSDRVQRAGRASYVERNREMIDDSDFCVFYFIEEYQPTADPKRASSGKSGTKLAYDYAVGKKKPILNIASRML